MSRNAGASCSRCLLAPSGFDVEDLQRSTHLEDLRRLVLGYIAEYPKQARYLLRREAGGSRVLADELADGGEQLG